MKTFNVTIVANTDRKTITVTEDMTVRQAFELAAIDPARGQFHLFAETINESNLDRTFAEFGAHDDCRISSVAKAENA